jgi:MFS superfamily sulfate permease-like transporter
MIKVSHQRQYQTPYGNSILEFILVNAAGHRVAKVSGDLAFEERSEIESRVAATIRDMRPVRIDWKNAPAINMTNGVESAEYVRQLRGE